MASSSVRLVVIGGGNMGGALVGGLIASRWCGPEELLVVEMVAARRAELAERHPGLNVAGEVDRAADAALIAVKPVDVGTACAVLGRAGATRVLSVAAGITTAALEAGLPPGTAVVRAMPNTPALIGAGAAAVSPGAAAGEDDLAWAEGILGTVGTVSRVPERLLDAVTGLSGSGPAYVFLVAEALIEAGVLVGLPRATSRELAVQTLLGSARLLAESGDLPEVLRANVTSPGGTTAAGLRELERSGVRAAFLDAVVAATERSRVLGG